MSQKNQLTIEQNATMWELALDLARYPDEVKLAAFDGLVTDIWNMLDQKTVMAFQVIIGRAAQALRG